MAGSATCSGEGGMIPDERRYSEKWFYQCIQSRYGFNPHHAQLADGIEVFIGQGQKVGMGGHLMGQKVTDQVAEIGENFDVSKMKKIVAGKKLWNYDNLEPTEKKGAI